MTDKNAWSQLLFKKEKSEAANITQPPSFPPSVPKASNTTSKSRPINKKEAQLPAPAPISNRKEINTSLEKIKKIQVGKESEKKKRCYHL
jgi:hypothetical protein